MPKRTHGSIDETGPRWERPAPNTRRLRERALLALLAVGLLAPGQALAVELIDIRVGQHPGFTRVVFEFDEPTGYQISRSENKAGGPSLVVKLDARSQPAQFSYTSGLVESLDLDRQQARASAQLTLREKGFRVKEMTLVDPFRVVIDVLPAVSATPVAARPKTVPKTAAKKPAPVKVAAAVKPPPQRKKAPPVASVQKAPEPSAKPAVKASAVAAAPTRPTPNPGTPVASQNAGKTAAASPSKPQPVTKPPAAKNPVASKGLEIPRVRNNSPSPAPSVTQAEPEEEGFSWLFAMVVLVPVLLLGGAAFAVSRRRSGVEFDESVFDELAPEPSESPFRVLESSSKVEGEALESGPNFVLETDDEETIELDPPVDTSLESYPVLEGVPVDESAEAVLESAASAMTEDIARVLKEVESRLSALEGQLSEFAEWKPGVEKRIAAQTEELRVQRAAIARTQRAVRQLSRPTEVSAKAPEQTSELPEPPLGEDPGSA